MIVGIDEVGRGAWAGPLVVGAVVMGGEAIEGLTDSKKLTAKKREALSLRIKQTARGIGIGWVSAQLVDKLGISKALTLACERALAGITCEYDQIIIDGTVRLLDDPRVTTMKQADLLVPSVSAASVVAKVARDAYMQVVSDTFPGYGFAQHVGYGTAVHQAAINELGVSPLHRMSFAPMKTMFANTVLQKPNQNLKNYEKDLSEAKNISLQTMSAASMDIARPAVQHEQTMGELAEQAATEYLIRRGFQILDRNWKTKWCEIDIIARIGSTIHFVEVKYRKSDRQGNGMAYITATKQRQMKFAAELWLSNQRDYDTALLSAISLSGQPAVVEQFIEQI